VSYSFNEWKLRKIQGIWNDDVWKAIYFLLRTRPDLEVFVADCDHGLGVITWAKDIRKSGKINISIEDVKVLSYLHLKNNREAILNLKNEDYLKEMIWGSNKFSN